MTKLTIKSIPQPKQFYARGKGPFCRTTALTDVERLKDLTFSSKGETSAGKSSLINLLLNQQVLPTGVLQNTLTICEISYGAKQEAVIHFKESSFKLEDTKFDALKQYIENPTNDEDECEKIEIKIPNPLLKVIYKILVNDYGFKIFLYVLWWF